jgi:hypothetical protein
MAEFTFVHKISVASLRDYIITHRIDQGDSIVLNPHDFEHLIHDIKNTSNELPDIPLTVVGVIVSQDSTDTIPIGKIQIVKNDSE